MSRHIRNARKLKARFQQQELIEPLSLLIETGVEKINQIINPEIPDYLEDTKQDIWVRVIEEHPESEDELRKIIHQVNSEHKREYYRNKYDIVSLDKPLLVGTNRQDKGLCLIDALTSIPGESCLKARFASPHQFISKQIPVFVRKSRKNPSIISCSCCSNKAYLVKDEGRLYPIYFCEQCQQRFYLNHDWKQKYNREVRIEVLKLRATGFTYREIIKLMKVKYALKFSLGGIAKWCRDEKQFGVNNPHAQSKGGWLSVSRIRLKQSNIVRNSINMSDDEFIEYASNRLLKNGGMESTQFDKAMENMLALRKALKRGERKELIEESA